MDKEPKGFVVPLFCFCSTKQHVFPSQASVSKLHRPLPFGRLNIDGEMNFPLRASSTLSFSLVNGRRSLACNDRSHFESDDAISAMLGTNRLNKLPNPRGNLNSATVASICDFRLESAVWFAISSFPGLKTRPIQFIQFVKRHTALVHVCHRHLLEDVVPILCVWCVILASWRISPIHRSTQRRISSRTMARLRLSRVEK